jgi:putative DNA primase/helicase
MSNLKAALAYGKAGFKIFPILEGTKDQPLIKQWGVRASRDPTQITVWWTRWPQANIGLACMPSGIGVIDSDVPKGEDTLDNLELIEGKVLSPTRMASTPRGGIHRFYRGTLATTAGKIGANVDTRGVGTNNGGYVLLAPSRTEVGTYRWINQKVPMAPIDPWVVAACGEKADTNRGPASQEPLVEWDQDSNIAWARNWLMNDAPMCRQGSGGGDTLVKFIVPQLKDHAISEEMAAEIISEPGGYNETKCEPPWSYGDCDDKDNLYVKIHNGFLYCRDNQPGVGTAGADFAGTEDETDEINRINAETVARMAARQREEAKRKKKPNGDGGLVTIRADEVKVRNIDHIWKGWLARGKHTLMAGAGGLGKSTIECDLTARITKALKWPDDSGNAPLGSVVILNAEDSREDTLTPRLIAAGADLSKVHFIKAIIPPGSNSGVERKFSLLTDLKALTVFCKNVGDVVLIIIDPASSYMGGDLSPDSGSNVKMRTVLDPLTQLAEELDCSILSITHFNKGSSNSAVNKVLDSVAWVNAPRAVFGVFRDNDTEEQKEQDFGEDSLAPPVAAGIVVPVKNNMGVWPVGLKYKIETAFGGVDFRDGKPVDTSRIVWGEKTRERADDIVAAEAARGGRPSRGVTQFAIDWLETTLGDAGSEGVPVDDVRAAADAAGITENALREARRRRRVRVVNSPDVPPRRAWALDAEAVRAEGMRMGAREIDLDTPPMTPKPRVQFIITMEMKDRLSQLGYSPDQVAQMNPMTAADIIGSGRQAWTKPQA